MAGLVLFLASVLPIQSCSPQDEPQKPYARNLTESSIPPEDVELGKFGSFEYTANGFSEMGQQLWCFFDPLQVEVWINNLKVASGQKMSYNINDQVIRITCCPLIEGDIVIELKVEDAEVVVGRSLSFNAVAKSYPVTLFNMPKMTMGYRRIIDMKITDSDNPGAINANYVVSAKVTTGKGIIHLSQDVVWNDTIPGFEPRVSIVPNETWVMMYTGFEVGDNELEFTVRDQAGRVSRSFVTIPVDSSEYKLTTTPKTVGTTILRNEKYEVFTQVDVMNHPANRFYVWGYYNAGSGRITANGTTMSDKETERIPVSRGVTLNFVPTSLGDQEAVVCFVDHYGSERYVKVDFTVEADDYTVDFGETPIYQNAMVLRGREFNISGSNDYNNQYRLAASVVEGDASKVLLRINGVEFLSAAEPLGIFKQEIVNSKFTAAGVYRIKYTFTDKWSDPKDHVVTYSIADNPLTVEHTKDRFRLMLGSVSNHTAQWSPTLSVAEGGTAELFVGSTVTLQSLQGEGVLQVNSTTLSLGESCEVSRNTSVLYFSPSKVGKHTLTLLYSLQDGRTAKKTIVVDVG